MSVPELRPPFSTPQGQNTARGEGSVNHNVLSPHHADPTSGSLGYSPREGLDSRTSRLYQTPQLFDSQAVSQSVAQVQYSTPPEQRTQILTQGGMPFSPQQGQRRVFTVQRSPAAIGQQPKVPQDQFRVEQTGNRFPQASALYSSGAPGLPFQAGLSAAVGSQPLEQRNQAAAGGQRTQVLPQGVMPSLPPQDQTSPAVLKYQERQRGNTTNQTPQHVDSQAVSQSVAQVQYSTPSQQDIEAAGSQPPEQRTQVLPQGGMPFSPQQGQRRVFMVQRSPAAIGQQPQGLPQGVIPSSPPQGQFRGGQTGNRFPQASALYSSGASGFSFQEGLTPAVGNQTLQQSNQAAVVSGQQPPQGGIPHQRRVSFQLPPAVGGNRPLQQQTQAPVMSGQQTQVLPQGVSTSQFGALQSGFSVQQGPAAAYGQPPQSLPQSRAVPQQFNTQPPRQTFQQPSFHPQQDSRWYGQQMSPVQFDSSAAPYSPTNQQEPTWATAREDIQKFNELATKHNEAFDKLEKAEKKQWSTSKVVGLIVAAIIGAILLGVGIWAAVAFGAKAGMTGTAMWAGLGAAGGVAVVGMGAVAAKNRSLKSDVAKAQTSYETACNELEPQSNLVQSRQSEANIAVAQQRTMSEREVDLPRYSGRPSGSPNTREEYDPVATFARQRQRDF